MIVAQQNIAIKLSDYMIGHEIVAKISIRK
jgi:hypothetical protein